MITLYSSLNPSVHRVELSKDTCKSIQLVYSCYEDTGDLSIELPMVNPRFNWEHVLKLVSYLQTTIPSFLFWSKYNMDYLSCMAEAATYLNCEPVLESIAKEIESRLIGKTTEEMRRLFHVNLSKAEHEQIQSLMTENKLT